MELITQHILEWYRENRRDLPWRNTVDPYLIWISEIILQQTRVSQGLDYYLRFTERFPTVHELAMASEDEVLKYWQGLGYYSRARNLHAAAIQIDSMGYFPDTYAGVKALKGVGEYTAAAICSFAYNLPYAVLDGNVYRVLSRLLGVDLPIDSTQGKKLFGDLAQTYLPTECPSEYNQAIMDFGALQCTPSSPCCHQCPLTLCCVAFQQNRVDKLPVKQHRTKVTHRYFNYVFIKQGEYTYLQKRTANDIWKNLYELPLVETQQLCTAEQFLALPAVSALFPLGSGAVWRVVKKDIKHVLSHRVIHATCYEVDIDTPEQLSQQLWQRVRIEDLHNFAVSRLINQIFSLLLTPEY